MELMKNVHTGKDGLVSLQLPPQLWESEVDIIVVPAERHKKNSEPKKSMRGCLQQFARPELISQEKEAWKEAAAEKHGHY